MLWQFDMGILVAPQWRTLRGAIIQLELIEYRPFSIPVAYSIDLSQKLNTLTLLNISLGRLWNSLSDNFVILYQIPEFCSIYAVIQGQRRSLGGICSKFGEENLASRLVLVFKFSLANVAINEAAELVAVLDGFKDEGGAHLVGGGRPPQIMNNHPKEPVPKLDLLLQDRNLIINCNRKLVLRQERQRVRPLWVVVLNQFRCLGAGATLRKLQVHEGHGVPLLSTGLRTEVLVAQNLLQLFRRTLLTFSLLTLSASSLTQILIIKRKAHSTFFLN